MENQNSYEPSQEILDKYASLLVDFALNDGNGINKGDRVFIAVPECARPMLDALRRQVLKSGGHPLIKYIPDNFSREFFELASEEQLTYFPEKLLKGRIEEIDHTIAIDADANPHEMKGISPEKIMKNQESMKPYMQWKDQKENRGEFSWTLAFYGTEAMAKEAGLTLEEYWNEIINACFLDYEDPKAEWRKVMDEIERVRKTLSEMSIRYLHLEAEGTDLWIKLDENRRWVGGSGHNIPSFEVFTSPDWRGTSGKIQFTEPLYVHGNLVKRAFLRFEEGKVIEAKAEEGEEFLRELIKTENADKVGEFSLTDKRVSRITKFMANTLYDENVGGENGNTHIAVGKSYADCYSGDPSKPTEKEWEEMGFNDSSVHTDIVATSDRKVTAKLADGSEKVIYKDGMFLV
ncbi:MAG: aminopeptidase [Candidatus Pacearchaeota archaeon]